MFFWVNPTNFCEVLSLNKLYLIEFSAFSLQKLPIVSIQILDLSQFTCFSWGKIWFERFDLCKKITFCNSDFSTPNKDQIGRKGQTYFSTLQYVSNQTSKGLLEIFQDFPQPTLFWSKAPYVYSG